MSCVVLVIAWEIVGEFLARARRGLDVRRAVARLHAQCCRGVSMALHFAFVPGRLRDLHAVLRSPCGGAVGLYDCMARVAANVHGPRIPLPLLDRLRGWLCIVLFRNPNLCTRHCVASTQRHVVVRWHRGSHDARDGSSGGR